jgi:hypothetical protein
MMKASDYDAFGERRRALEEAFFRDRDAKLLQKLRDELAAMEDRNKLAHVSGIMDENVLIDLVQAGVQAETLLAMRLVPMVVVAWSDGQIAPEERAAILNAAAAEGIAPGSATHDLLVRWLDQQPDERIVTAWKEYVSAVARMMPAESLTEIKRQMLDRCRRVARARGGLLGYGAISAAEQATIDEFASAYDRH